MSEAFVIDSKTAGDIAREDYHDDQKRHDATPYPEIWKQWQEELEKAGKKIDSEYGAKIKDRESQVALLEEDVKNAQADIERLSNERRQFDESSSRKIADIERQIDQAESTFAARRPPVSPTLYAVGLSVFGLAEMPFNAYAFQSLEFSSRIAIALVSVMVGLALAFAAHYIGKLWSQFPLPSRDPQITRKRKSSMYQIVAISILVVTMYILITMFREGSLHYASLKFFSFLLCLNALLFFGMVVFSRNAHIPDETKHNQWVAQRDRIKELQDDLEQALKDRTARLEQIEKEIEKARAKKTDIEKKIIVIAGERDKLRHEHECVRQSLDDELQAAIAAYTDAYMSLRKENDPVPSWADPNTRPELHVAA